jgi:hypothetical protein
MTPTTDTITTVTAIVITATAMTTITVTMGTVAVTAGAMGAITAEEVRVIMPAVTIPAVAVITRAMKGGAALRSSVTRSRHRPAAGTATGVAAARAGATRIKTVTSNPAVDRDGPWHETTAPHNRPADKH